jgi:DNA-binding transcriptional regulator GbsR (MarR family)
MANSDDVRRDFVELWGQLAPFWGVPPTTGRVYGYLISREAPQTATEIMDGAKLSRGAVSMACRELLDWGLVESARAGEVDGELSRQIAYRPETDLEKVIRNIVRARKRREWDPMLGRLREWTTKLAGERDAEARIFRERLVAIEGMVSLAESMSESFLKGGLVQRLGLKALVETAKRRSRQGRSG